MQNCSIRFRGKEVKNLVMRSILSVIASGLVIILVPMAMIAFVLTIILFPIWLPMHYLLRTCDRKGFIRKDGSICINTEAFHKA